MRTIPILAALLLVAPLVPATAHEGRAMPADIAAALEARGIPASAWSDVRVVRHTTTPEGESTSVLTLDAWLASSPQLAALELPRATQRVGSNTDVVAGDLLLHLMLQFDCSGYRASSVGAGVTTVDGAWDIIGLHVVLHPTAGWPSVGTMDPTTSYLAYDSSAQAAGMLTITEDRIEIFGICLFLVGTMAGPGAFAFDAPL